MSFTRRPGLGRHRHTSCREERHIVINARIQPAASSATIHAQGALSLGAPVSFRTIRRCLAEGHLRSWCPLRVLPLTPTIDSSVWSGATHEKTGLQRNGTRSSLVTNPDSISAVMTIVFVCGDPVVTPQSCLFFNTTHHSHSYCNGIGCHCLQYTATSSIDMWHHDIRVVCP
ncbi:HTH_Tnp_Tc3_2 domain-containing protein [Trichonephila clavipes]|nr:HTH_Tnp_Tc3_2 domain-containing protein [Trichonephila clavipes]